MNRKNDLYPFIFEQSVHTEVVIACFDELSKTLKKKTVVVMDKLQSTPAKNLKNVYLNGKSKD